MPKDTTVSPQPDLLGFLMLGPRHPYEFHQEFNRELGRVWHIGQSHLYAYLKQLAEAGLATVKTEAQPNRPSRNIYQITPAGQEAFLNWLHQPTQHSRHIRLNFWLGSISSGDCHCRDWINSWPIKKHCSSCAWSR
jgi:DNA-binding PadR family transcriptional regulator